MIAHVDMDAFFASVEQLECPELRGKPVIIGADPDQGRGRGVVSTASYEARQYGVHSAMPISQAYKKCPNGVFLHPDMEKYCNYSRKFLHALANISPRIESAGIDEAYVDISGLSALFGDTRKIGSRIIESVHAETGGLSCSVGIAAGKYTAKIASDFKKPGGLTIIDPGQEAGFLAPLHVRKLSGIGPKSGAILENLGIIRIGQIAALTQSDVLDILGKSGPDLWQIANGCDGSTVVYTAEEKDPRKSMSSEHTFGVDCGDDGVVAGVLLKISEDLSRGLRKEALFAKTVTLKIRLSGFETFTRNKTHEKAIQNTGEIRSSALALFHSFDTGRKAIRLLGISLSGLVSAPSAQLSFFHDDTVKERAVEKAIDKIKQKFGKASITRAALLELGDSG